MLQPEVVDSDHVFRVAYWHNAVIVDVGGDMDLVHMQRLGRAYRDLLAQNPGGIVSCAFLRAEVPVSSAAARAESARFMKELGDSILRVAMVSEHRGVLMQMITTIIRGINVIARNRNWCCCALRRRWLRPWHPWCNRKTPRPRRQRP